MTTADGDLYLGVDAGTSGCKAVVLTAGGTVAGEGWAGYESTAGPDGAITQSADDWVTAMERATLQALSGLDGRRVVAMSVTAPAYNCVLLGADDRPTGDVVLWSDPRPGIDAAALRASHGDLIREHALVELGPGHTASQLRCLLRSEPSRMAATRSLLIGKDYLRFVLTGVRAIDPSNAASTALFDVRSGEWMAMLCADIGIDPSWLPGVVSSLDDGAALTEHWGQRLGLRAGCPVVAGANDTSDELVSVGATTPGSGVVKIATTGTVVVVDAVPHPAAGLLTYPHAEAGMWYTLAATNTAGGALAWLCTNVLGGTGDADDIRRIEQLAGGVGAGADGLTAFPWFAGERAAVQRADVRAAFLGAGIEHTPAHFGRAVMEAAAFALADCRDALAGEGLVVERPVLTGGGLRSELWQQIVVAVLDTIAVVTKPCEPAVGAAVLAARSVAAPFDVRRTESRVVTADPGLVDTYGPLLERYRSLRSAVAAISSR